MTNGKGDRNRTTNTKKFRDNYSEINWRGKNDCKHCGQPLDKHSGSIDLSDGKHVCYTN